MHSPSSLEGVAALLFGLAVLHTFFCGRFQVVAKRFPEGSVGENLFHLLGEIEVVFGLWAAVLLAVMAGVEGRGAVIQYVEGLSFTEALFVFVIMAVASTRPVIQFARGLILGIAQVLPGPREAAAYTACLSIGPLLGSLITEPAAMTVTALILKARYYDTPVSARFKYVTLAVLFVNVSIGGTLTHFAAPPVLMVAAKWGWGLTHMLQTFGWKAALATFLNAIGAALVLRRELRSVAPSPEKQVSWVPPWVIAVHLAFLVLIVMTAHHPVIFIGIFMGFMGVATITKEFQDDILLRQSLLVSFFLAGLVVLGGLQGWWLGPLIGGMDSFSLFLGATVLTAVTDNAALTYLGAQIGSVSESFKYALVAGAVSGGGLTVIANAPNPAAYAILQERFGDEGIRPVRLLFAALMPTLVAMLSFWLL